MKAELDNMDAMVLYIAVYNKELGTFSVQSIWGYLAGRGEIKDPEKEPPENPHKLYKAKTDNKND